MTFVQKKIFFLFVCLFCTQLTHAQLKEVNVGLFFGSSQYNGEINMTKAYYSPHLTGGLHVKQVYNYHYTLRFAVSYAELKGYDKDFDNLFQHHRAHEFSDNNIYEFTALTEFNFFQVTPDREEDNFSPYVVGGLGVFYADELEWYQILNIPMGIGLKFRIATRAELNLEWVFRKTFTDKLDRLESSGIGYKNFKQYSFENTNDWYSILGISVLFSFLNPQSPCPVYYKKPYELGKRNK